MSKRVADLLVDVLAKAGVQRIYGVPGDSLNGVTDSIRTRENIQWIGVRHEEAAAFAAVSAGAQFLVSPAVVEDVLRAGRRYGLPVLPGAATPSETHLAMELGADMVKLFPAGSLGVEFMRSISAAMPHVPFVATGGVTADNALDWLDAGAVAVGVGGALTRGNPAGIQQRAEELVALLRR